MNADRSCASPDVGRSGSSHLRSTSASLRQLKRVLATLFLLVVTTWAVAATPPARMDVQAPASAVVSTTGDAWVDATLDDMDRYAARYPDAFVDELNRYDGAPRDLVVQLLATPRWTAGDVYFACALARIAAQPCRAVASLRDPAQPWTTIMQHFGIGATSAQFHRLKRGVVLSYERWARPLAVDASLHAEFPSHPLSDGGAPTADTATTPKKPGKGRTR